MSQTQDFVDYFPSEVITEIFNQIPYHLISGALAANKKWSFYASDRIVKFASEAFVVDRVNEEHLRINMLAKKDLDHSTFLNYHLHHLSIFNKIELRIKYPEEVIILDQPALHIAQLATLTNLRNLELIRIPKMCDKYEWNQLSTLSQLRRVYVDCFRTTISFDWLPNDLCSLRLDRVPLDSNIAWIIPRLTLLDDLYLHYPKNVTSKSFNKICNALQSTLTRLELWESEPEARVWQSLLLLTRLEALAVASTPSTNLNLITQLTTLRSFRLAEIVKDYDKLAHMSNLTSLAVYCYSKTDRIMNEAMKLTSLERLMLNPCACFTDDTFTALLTRLPNLYHLGIGGAPMVTENALHYLNQFSKLTHVVHYEVPGWTNTTINTKFLLTRKYPLDL